MKQQQYNDNFWESFKIDEIDLDNHTDRIGAIWSLPKHFRSPNEPARVMQATQTASRVGCVTSNPRGIFNG